MVQIKRCEPGHIGDMAILSAQIAIDRLSESGIELAPNSLRMKATRSRGGRRPTAITVRPSDGSPPDDLIVMVPESGADVDAVERALIAFALTKTGGNRTHAARFLGLSRSALIYRMHKHRLVDAAAGDH